VITFASGGEKLVAIRTGRVLRPAVCAQIYGEQNAKRTLNNLVKLKGTVPSLESVVERRRMMLIDRIRKDVTSQQ
jgi:hypothetical protein